METRIPSRRPARARAGEPSSERLSAKESSSSKEARLVEILNRAGRAAIAVSGGVDSMTLAHIAARRSTAPVDMFHAVSPAVPPHATERVRAHAERFGWRLHVVGAGEFDDPDYLRNPLNRCYFCKTNLYARIRAALGSRSDAVVCSGANLDDLGDFRPGLGAAAEQGVRHPFVEAGIGKRDIRRLAADFGLDDLAELPAQPCLASRVETGLAIEPDALALIDRVEQALAAALAGEVDGPADFRCRLTREGVRLELPPALAAAPTPRVREAVAAAAREILAAERPFAGVGPYRRGSAFLQGGGGARVAKTEAS